MESGYKSLRLDAMKRVRKRTRTRTTGKRRLGRQPGAKNKSTLHRELLAKQAMLATDRPFAVDLMDAEIERLAELVRLLHPWDENGVPIKGKSVQSFLWASELRRDYLQMRARIRRPGCRLCRSFRQASRTA
jgi:hypothetical protein